MKKIILTLLIALPFFLQAQNNEGIITYEEVLTLNIELPEEMKQYASLIPKEQRNKMNLFFNGKESLYTASKEVEASEDNPFSSNVNVNIQTVSIGGGGQTVIYTDLENAKLLRSENLMGQQFLVKGKSEEMAWKVLGEQKKIAGYTCVKAELATDSSTLVAWFAPEIPASVGPMSFRGLPGAILEMETNQGESGLTVTAIKVNLHPLEEAIKKPKKGKKVSEEEFDTIVAERMSEMRKMRGNGSRSENGNTVIEIRTGN